MNDQDRITQLEASCAAIMKTPEQWLQETPLDDFSTGEALRFIAAIQSDARKGMVSKGELRPTIELLKNDILPYFTEEDQDLRKEITRLETLLGDKEVK